MPNAKKRVISDSQKNALAQKEPGAAPKTETAPAGDFAKEGQLGESKPITTPRRQKMIQQKIAEIHLYRGKLEKAEKQEKDGTYRLLAKLMFGAFVATAILIAASFIFNFGQEIMLIALALAFAFLIISTACQSKSLKLELEIKEYTAKLKRAKKELLNLKIPPQP